MTHDTKAGTSSNCFYNNDLTYVYDLFDYSGNYTNVKEYTMKKGTECDFIVDTKSKITWYAPDLEVKMLIYQDLAKGCSANKFD
tara:strand:+ start:248 stop:499 length:252 start_codon:yes stop_codon:yes gene_type:complete